MLPKDTHEFQAIFGRVFCILSKRRLMMISKDITSNSVGSVRFNPKLAQVRKLSLLLTSCSTSLKLDSFNLEII